MLSDPDKRERYDRLGANWRQQEQAAPDANFEEFFARQGFGSDDTRVEFSDDLFERLFGGGAGGGAGWRSGGPLRGLDREALLELSLEDALEGGRRRLTLDHREIDVNFPAGVRDGQLIRLAGQGAPGRDGGPPGDLYLRIALKPHPHFRRRGERRPRRRPSGGAVAGGARCDRPGPDADAAPPRSGCLPAPPAGGDCGCAGGGCRSPGAAAAISTRSSRSPFPSSCPTVNASSTSSSRRARRGRRPHEQRRAGGAGRRRAAGRASGSRSSAAIWSSACSSRTLSRPRRRATTRAAPHGSRGRSGCAATSGSTTPARCSSANYSTGSANSKRNSSSRGQSVFGKRSKVALDLAVPRHS